MRNQVRNVVLMLLLLGGLFLPFTSPACGQGQDDTVEVEGIATIQRDNRGQARDNAILDAQRKAVEQVAGVVLSSFSEVQNYELTSEVIISQTAGYVRSYTLLEERAVRKEYQVRLRVVVASGDIADEAQAIQLLLRQKGDPRMMFLVEETVMDVASPDMSQAETTFLQAFLETGFRVVDFDTVRQNIQRDQQLQAIAGNTSVAAAIAQQHGADVVIAASAVANSGGQVLKTKLQTLQAQVTAKVIWVDTGAVICSGSERARTAHIDELTGGLIAIEKASTALAEEILKPKILEQWRKEVYSATSVQLVVTDVSFQQLRRLKKLLQTDIRGVQSVTQREFIQKAATLEVMIQGTAETLAEELVSREFQGIAFEITGMSGNRIDLAIIK